MGGRLYTLDLESAARVVEVGGSLVIVSELWVENSDSVDDGRHIGGTAVFEDNEEPVFRGSRGRSPSSIGTNCG